MEEFPVLTAEMIRDNVLVSSGLFVNKIGGPSVKPYQPPGLWDEMTGGSTSNSLKRYVMSTDGQKLTAEMIEERIYGLLEKNGSSPWDDYFSMHVNRR